MFNKYITLNDHQVISISDHRITFFSYGVGPFIPIKHNAAHVLKLNKKSISTCNVEMLAEYLNNNHDMAKKLFGVVSYSGDIDSIRPVTLAAFYNSYNDDPSLFVEFFKSCSHETKQQIIFDHCCRDHDGKMDGVISLSSYVGANRYCAARCNNCDNAICKYCFADSLTKQRIGLKNKLRRTHAILTQVELNAQDIPTIDSNIWPFFRLEAFGDLNNVIQFNNYNLFAAVNPDVNFTLWSKNPGVIQSAINGGTVIADNLVIGLSSLYLNTPELKKAQRYPFIRFLFTVYTEDYIRAHDVQINCGAKHCASCGICYKYLHEFKHGLQLINERKK